MIEVEQGQDPVLEKARQLRAAGVPLAEIERYVASKRQPVASGPITPGHSKLTSEQLIRRAAGAVTDAKAEEPSPAERVTGTLAAVGRGIPGVPQLQAYSRAMVRGKGHVNLPGPAGGIPIPFPFVDDLATAEADIEDAESAAPKGAGRIASTAGTVLGAVATGVPQLVQSGLRLIPAAAKAASGRAGTVVDVARLFTGNGAPLGRRLFRGALETAMDGVEQAATKAPAPFASPASVTSTVEGVQPGSGALARALAKAQKPVAEAVERRAPRAELEGVFQRALDESQAAAKAGPESTNWDLMQRMEEGLLKAKGSTAPSSVPRLRALDAQREEQSIKTIFNELLTQPQWRGQPAEDVLKVATQMARAASH